MANEQVLALESVMNQRRLIRKTVLVQGGGATRAKTELARQGSVKDEEIILTATPAEPADCCVLL